MECISGKSTTDSVLTKLQVGNSRSAGTTPSVDRAEPVVYNNENRKGRPTLG